MCNDGSSDYDCQQLKELFYSHLLKSDQINSTIEVVYQFLLHHDFNSTAQSLIQEVKKVNVRGLENPIKMSKSFMEPSKQILLNYEFGDGNTFFELWDKYVPDDIKTYKEYKILTLKLHVYFVILSKSMLLSIQQNSHEKQTNKEPFIKEDPSQRCITELEEDFSKNMARLQQYLSMDGKELKHETQLRAFFALPYLEDPLSDPLFHEIFDKTWSDELFMHLQEFIAKYVQDKRDCEESDPSNLLETTTSALTFKISDTDKSEKMLVKNNTLIIPNERDMPGYFEENKSEERLSTYYEKTHNMESKSTQTYSHFVPNDSQHCLVKDLDQQIVCQCHHKSHQYNEELALTKSHLYNVHSNYKKLKSRFHKLHGDYHKLLSVAAELTTVLESSVRGQPVDLQGMLESCMKIFPDLFNQNIRDELQVQQSGDTSTQDIVQPNFNIINISPKLLDFKKIKLHLINGNVKTKLLLLQALRWKITLSQPAERDEVIHEYISSDLLGLHGQIASDNGKSILPYLLVPENVPMPHPLQQSTARLLNTFASLRCGRDYLSMDSSVVKVIFNCLNDNCHDGVDAFTYDMMLSTLQKLSLRKQQRLYMIESGLLEWLIHHLHNENDTMSSYRLKYATALLMNLSLHKQAQIKISTKASLLMSTFTMLLAIDHPSVSPYVNGALNNFLANDQINDEARKVNLSSILEQLYKNKTGEIRKCLKHILKVHKRECTIDIEEEAISDNDNEEFEVLENELDENDPVKNHKAELYGDVLLSTCYMIIPDALQKESPAITIDTTSYEVLEKTSDVKLLPQQKNKQHNKFCSNNCLPLLDEYPQRSMWKEEKEKSKYKLQTQRIYTDSEHFSNHHYHFFNSSDNSMLKLFKTKVLLNRNSSAYSGSLYTTNQSEFSMFGENVRNVTYISNTYNAMNEESNKELVQTNSKKVDIIKPILTKKAMRDDATVYLYENQTSKESSTMTIPSSITLESTIEDKKEPDKLSSIASLNKMNNDKNGIKFKCDKEEEAFLAKPKISRTPPHLH